MSHGGYDYGLEDKILRKNIPGRYSTWDKDSDEVGPKARNEWVDEEGVEDAEPSPTPPQNPQQLLNGNGGRRTGPKGVLQDYKDHKFIEEYNSRITQLENQEKYHREAYGATRPSELSDESLKKTSEHDVEVENELLLIRQKRLAAMQAAVSMPVFGEVREVGALEFLDAIEKEDPRVMVIVHIYEETNKSCRKMNTAIGNLSKTYTRVKFLRLPVSEAPSGSAFDADTLPVIVSYRNGDLVESIVRCTDHISEQLTTSEVEWLLNEHGLLDVMLSATNSSSTFTKKNTCFASERVKRFDEYDDDEDCFDEDGDVEHDLGVD